MLHTRSVRSIRRASVLLTVVAVLFAGFAIAQPASAQASRNPSGLDAQVTSGQVVLTWTAGNHPRATGQRIVRREARGRWATIADVAVDAVTYTDTTVVKGRKYIYRVQNLLGNRARGTSNRAVVEPSANPAAATVPNPTSLSVSIDGGAVVLSWTAGTDSRITTQRVMRRAPKEGWTSFSVARDATTYRDTSAQSGQRYIYRVESRAGNRGLGVSNRAVVRVQ